CDSATPPATGHSQVLALLIDGTPPPAPRFVSEAGGLDFDTGYLSLSARDASSLPGVQHRVTLLVPTGDEDPQGWRVQLTVTPPGGARTVYERRLAGASGDPARVVFEAVDFGAADGEVMLSAVV